MASLKADHPSVKKVLTALADVGLNHSTIMGNGVVLEGGVDPLKAVRVKAFAEKVTDGEGMIGRDTIERGMLHGRRALLAHVVDGLVTNGTELVKKDLHHALTVDETYEIKVDGTTIQLILMPR